MISQLMGRVLMPTQMPPVMGDKRIPLSMFGRVPKIVEGVGEATMTETPEDLKLPQIEETPPLLPEQKDDLTPMPGTKLPQLVDVAHETPKEGPDLEIQEKDPKDLITQTYVGPHSKGWNDSDEGKFSNLTDKMPRKEISDEGANITNEAKDLAEFGGSDEMYLSEAINHPQLFKEYPSLSMMPLKLTDGADEKGISDDSGISVSRVNISSGNPRLLLHEIQHKIQDMEGFAQGGSPEEFIKYNQNEMERINKEQADRLRYLIKLALAEGKTEKDVLNSPEGKLISENLLKLQSEIRYPDRQYRSLAGEIEARDVQARKDFTPEQRRSVSPLSSQGISLKDMIVKMKSGSTPSLFEGIGESTPRGEGGIESAIKSIKEKNPLPDQNSMSSKEWEAKYGESGADSYLLDKHFKMVERQKLIDTLPEVSKIIDEVPGLWDVQVSAPDGVSIKKSSTSYREARKILRESGDLNETDKPFLEHKQGEYPSGQYSIGNSLRVVDPDGVVTQLLPKDAKAEAFYKQSKDYLKQIVNHDFTPPKLISTPTGEGNKTFKSKG